MLHGRMAPLTTWEQVETLISVRFYALIDAPPRWCWCRTAGLRRLPCTMVGDIQAKIHLWLMIFFWQLLCSQCLEWYAKVTKSSRSPGLKFNTFSVSNKNRIVTGIIVSPSLWEKLMIDLRHRASRRLRPWVRSTSHLNAAPILGQELIVTISSLWCG